MPAVAAGLLVFCVSAAILILEIVAARLLAPYVGVSLETYTGIIGTVLAGIALGNWAGGRLADRFDPRRLLGPMLTLGGLLAIISPSAVTIAGSAIPGHGPAAIVTLAAVGFFAPAAVLSAVSPTVVKIQLDDLHRTGSVVGQLAGLGTAGAILGTFAAGFLLVSAFPSRAIVLGVGVCLVAAGVLLWWLLHPGTARGVLPVAVAAALAAGALAAVPPTCERESYYFCARVVDDPDRDGGRTLLLDTVRHSYVDLDDPTHLELSYARMLGAVIDATHPAPRPVDTLHIGGGGFTMPRWLAATRPGSTNVVLELDASLVRLSEDELGLDPTDDLDIHTGDARMTLAEVPPTSADLAIGDAFSGLSVPWHLTTVEFLEQVRERLRPGGTYVMNLVDHPPHDFVRAEAATARAVFDEVVLLAPDPRLRGEQGGNVLLIATDGPLPHDLLLTHPEAAEQDLTVLRGEDLTRFLGAARTLTDAFAPVDQLARLRP
jgi:spermidine synthase